VLRPFNRPLNLLQEDLVFTLPWVKIRNTREYSLVYKNGKKFIGRFVVVFVYKNQLEFSRYGVVASKKVGKAVKRNKAKRRLKDMIGRMHNQVVPGYDIVLTARNALPQADFDLIIKEGEKLFKKAGLV
jgi:ribonuclease P protein component